MKEKQWYVYLMRCADDSLYCGITTDIERRLQEHNGNKKGGAKYTKSRRPVALYAYAPCATHSEAAQYEAHIKKMPRHKKITAFCVQNDNIASKEKDTV